MDEQLFSSIPLRERKADIPGLVRCFIDKFKKLHNSKVSGISARAMDELTKYPWPGGIRELENIVERLVILSSTNKILKKDIPLKIKLGGDKTCLQDEY